MWRAQRSGIPLVSEGFGHFALQVESGSVAGLHFLFDLQRKSASQRVWRNRSAIFCRPATETPADLRQNLGRLAPKTLQTCAKNVADLRQKCHWPSPRKKGYRRKIVVSDIAPKPLIYKPVKIQQQLAWTITKTSRGNNKNGSVQWHRPVFLL